MRWTTIFQASATAGLGQALIIPADIAADGIYQVVSKADGTEVHTKIANVTYDGNNYLDNVRALDRRFSGQLWCRCDQQLDNRNCDAAVADMTNAMSSGPVLPGLSFYSIRGDVLAFACNRGEEPFPAYDGFRDFVQHIVDNCGSYVAGSSQLVETIMGYMQYQNGRDFCAASTTSLHSHC
jgi:hypothetical protein